MQVEGGELIASSSAGGGGGGATSEAVLWTAALPQAPACVGGGSLWSKIVVVRKRIFCDAI